MSDKQSLKRLQEIRRWVAERWVNDAVKATVMTMLDEMVCERGHLPAGSG